MTHTKDKHAKPAHENNKSEEAKTAAEPPPTAAEQAKETVPATPAPPSETEALKDRLLRLQADFDNFRKRTLREKNDLYQRANMDLLQEILPVLDHFELGLNMAEQHKVEKAVIDGLKLVYDQFQNTLKKFGVAPIETEDQAFDPTVHEAVTHIPSEEQPADTIIAVTRRGYRLGEQLLRASQVVVSSGPAEKPAAEPPAPSEPGSEPNESEGVP